MLINENTEIINIDYMAYSYLNMLIDENTLNEKLKNGNVNIISNPERWSLSWIRRPIFYYLVLI